eukprot:SAG22_NODE_92_length_20892_cov_11.188429_4_plen_617_part_00
MRRKAALYSESLKARTGTLALSVEGARGLPPERSKYYVKIEAYMRGTDKARTGITVGVDGTAVWRGKTRLSRFERVMAKTVVVNSVYRRQARSDTNLRDYRDVLFGWRRLRVSELSGAMTGEKVDCWITLRQDQMRGMMSTDPTGRHKPEIRIRGVFKFDNTVPKYNSFTMLAATAVYEAAMAGALERQHKWAASSRRLLVVTDKDGEGEETMEVEKDELHPAQTNETRRPATPPLPSFADGVDDYREFYLCAARQKWTWSKMTAVQNGDQGEDADSTTSAGAQVRPPPGLNWQAMAPAGRLAEAPPELPGQPSHLITLANLQNVTAAAVYSHRHPPPASPTPQSCPICRKSVRNQLSRLVFTETECPICLQRVSPVVALGCGHVLCEADFKELGGILPEEAESPRRQTDKAHKVQLQAAVEEVITSSRFVAETKLLSDLLAQHKHKAVQDLSALQAAELKFTGVVDQSSRDRIRAKQRQQKQQLHADMEELDVTLGALLADASIDNTALKEASQDFENEAAAAEDADGTDDDADFGYGVSQALDQFRKHSLAHQKKQHTSKQNLAARLEAKKMDAAGRAMKIRLQRLEMIIDRNGRKIDDHLDRVFAYCQETGET